MTKYPIYFVQSNDITFRVDVAKMTQYQSLEESWNGSRS